MKLLIVFLFSLTSAQAQDKVIETMDKAFNAVKTAGLPEGYKACSVISATNYGKDPSYTVSLKNYPRPSQGCIDAQSVSKEEADKLITSQNFITIDATAKERIVLGTAIKRVQELNGGILKAGVGNKAGGLPWKYYDANGSAQKYDHIKIGRNKAKRGHQHYGHSVAQHVHEWAHLIGNQGGYAAFQKFMNENYSSKDYCMVSNYADNSSGEQFAEAFTAFVTEPSLLLNNSRTPDNCKKVFAFFWDWLDQGYKVQDCL